MAAPSPRNSIRIARGLYADLLADVAALGDGEICYATDADKLYIKQNGTLEPAAANAADITASGVNPGDNISIFTNDVPYLTAADIGGGNTGILYVDTTGNDLTAVPGDVSKPYATIKAACTAASTGQVVKINAGTYVEQNPISVPAGVLVTSAVGDQGWVGDAVLVQPASTSSDLFQLSASSAVNGFTIELPPTLGAAGVSYSGGAATTASVTNLGIRGTLGGQGTGISVRSTSSGKIISFEIRYKGGQLNRLLEVTGGILATESIHVPNVAGTNSINACIYQSDSLGSPVSRYQGVANNCGNNNVDTFYVNDGGTGVFYGVNFFNGDKAIRLTSNSYNVSFFGGLLESVNAWLTVDAGITGSSGKIYVDAYVTKKFAIDEPTWWTSDYAFEFFADRDDQEAVLSSKQIQGQSLVVGDKRNPQGMIVGGGSLFNEGLQVFSASNVTSGTDGTGFADLSALAASKDPVDNFTFSSNAVDEVLYFGTTARDKNNNLLKHFALQFTMLAGDTRDGTYAYEVWDGGNWVTYDYQVVSRGNSYNYSDKLFWRGSALELMWTGVRANTTWATKAINGVSAYWSRIRITSSPTGTPTIIQTLLAPEGGFAVNTNGSVIYFGTAQFRYSLQQGGNIFSESGGVTNASIPLGTGANSWNHISTNSVLNGNSDAIYWQIRIPEGTCTAFPLELEVVVQPTVGFNAASKPQLRASLHHMTVVGNYIADPAGGVVPVPSTAANSKTIVTEAPDAYTVTMDDDQENYLYRLKFGPFPMASHYEGDIAALKLELIDDGSNNADIAIWNVDLRGYRWTAGESQEI
jgi:hypothetical protein